MSNEMNALMSEVTGSATPEPAPAKEIRDLVKGDKVFVYFYGFSNNVSVCKVERVTPTGLIVVRTSDIATRTFKPSGYERGASVRHAATIAIWSEERERELKEEAAEQERRHELISFIESRSYRHMSTATLARLESVIKQDAEAK